MRFDRGVQTYVQAFTADSGGGANIDISPAYGNLVRISYIKGNNSASSWNFRIRDELGIALEIYVLGNADSTFMPSKTTSVGANSKNYHTFSGTCSGLVVGATANSTGTLKFYFLTESLNMRQQGAEY